MLRPSGKLLASLALVLATMVLESRTIRAEPVEPVAVLTVQSVDNTLDAVRYVLAVTNQEDRAKQIDGLLGALTSGKRFQGVDTKKPLGAYVAKFEDAAGTPPIVAFVPLTNKDEFIDLLKQIGLELGQPEKDVYTVDTPLGIPLSLRFANNHAYAAMGADLLQGDLPDPSTFVPKNNLKSLLAATLKLDKMPEEYRKFAVEQVQAQFDNDKEKREGEADEDYALRLALLKSVKETATHVINGAQHVTLSLDVDQKDGNMALDVAMHPKPGSKLADKIKDLGPAEPTAPVHFEISVMKLAQFFVADGDDEKLGEIRKIIASTEKGKDKVKFTMFGGEALRVRFEVNAQVIRLFAILSPQGLPQ